MQTIREHFGVSLLSGLKLAFIGDGNNVAQSLMLTGLRLGMDFALGCPEGYLPDPEIVTQAEGLAAVSGATPADHARYRAPPSTARTPSTPTSGPAWGRNRKPSSASAPSATTR